MLLRLGSMLARRGLHAASARFAAAPALRLGRSRALSTAPVDDEMEDDIDVDGVAYGFMASQALFAGLELGIFDAIAAAGGSVDLPSLQRSSGVTAPRLQTLLTALVASKALRRSRDGAYDLSPNAARFLVSSSRHFYGDYLKLQIGRQFYHRMGALTDVMKTGEAPSYASWFSDPEVAATYTRAQHNGSVATAKALLKRMAGSVSLDGASKMLDVGGGSGAFSYVQQRVSFSELDATSPDWPVLMSYISGSVPEPVVGALYANAYKARQSSGSGWWWWCTTSWWTTRSTGRSAAPSGRCST
ncbi:hypothetical protein EMIHUDRAFT_117831 [Emiliania huxleyi CCMP1516]|uniref:O-methyltransferase dimerisation domain-containing protein n=2 Tax=Emiliania huxleyi TaxID=2903 RepID=A0A0D3J8G6_EMIH1|nr:hypothetical protein EMIHUDRAFT_117831 [Emiliania huxleyi CCMP1516]EOD19801.1 hypothetical protein EMIHUDRAFT_117831 [Emiliania huxleyi CCMP1516]|eukprot:XP_005772230.1 hypothetical protein EMIHUDRAFT_117831 [Emiliania huxleyi CCMP1516]